MNREQKLLIAQNVFEQEITTLKTIKNLLDDKFIEIEEAIVACTGKVVLCGMGKSGHIAKKIAATFSSLGTPSFFLHPAEAMHGDLGMVSQNDVVIMLSNSGETQEILSAIPSLKLIGAKLIAITGNEESTLAKECEIAQTIHIEKEALNPYSSDAVTARASP